MAAESIVPPLCDVVNAPLPTAGELPALGVPEVGPGSPELEAYSLLLRLDEPVEATTPVLEPPEGPRLFVLDVVAAADMEADEAVLSAETVTAEEDSMEAESASEVNCVEEGMKELVYVY